MKAEEILDYCIDYLLEGKEFPKNEKEKKMYREMRAEIEFLLETD